jgi:hypothetical protein
MEYPCKQEMESAMETTIQLQTESTLEHDSLLLASLILMDVSRIIRDIQAIVAVLLRYATMAMSITNGLIELILPEASEKR